jgi:hypothetical protein
MGCRLAAFNKQHCQLQDSVPPARVNPLIILKPACRVGEVALTMAQPQWLLLLKCQVELLVLSKATTFLMQQNLKVCCVACDLVGCRAHAGGP